MNNRLEQFINDHREEFDGEEPSKKIWDNIQHQLDPPKKQQAQVISFNWKKWSAAAAVVILIGGAALYINTKKNNNNAGQFANAKNPAATNELPITQPVVKDTTAQVAQADVKPKDENKKTEPVVDEKVSDMNEEMYHFAKLVEIKHKELKRIEKDEPLLYKQFAGDVNKLDSVYHSLEKQLPENPNREQLIEAMIQNLQLQMDLLNHQLTIIKQINHSKKSAYEKAFKST
jgi:hypothetical protein